MTMRLDFPLFFKAIFKVRTSHSASKVLTDLLGSGFLHGFPRGGLPICRGLCLQQSRIKGD